MGWWGCARRIDAGLFNNRTCIEQSFSFKSLSDSSGLPPYSVPGFFVPEIGTCGNAACQAQKALGVRPFRVAGASPNCRARLACGTSKAALGWDRATHRPAHPADGSAVTREGRGTRWVSIPGVRAASGHPLALLEREVHPTSGERMGRAVSRKRSPRSVGKERGSSSRPGEMRNEVAWAQAENSPPGISVGNCRCCFTVGCRQCRGDATRLPAQCRLPGSARLEVGVLGGSSPVMSPRLPSHAQGPCKQAFRWREGRWLN